jgi:transcriptional regulator with XRE-family HTH domain
MENFPERLRMLRESARPVRSMKVTSELCGLHPDAIRRYERGEAKPDAEALEMIADYFGVSMDYLWRGEN